jgi:hypothetical protein
METINNLAGAASKAIWGDNAQSGTEPVAGEQGEGTKTDPYDQGNEEENQKGRHLHSL